MIQYIPFLKAKRGELTAMGELSSSVKQAICPFFDFPRRKQGYNAKTYAATASNIVASLKKHWGCEAEFYFDDLDIDQGLKVDGEHQYAYMLKALGALNVIPVVSLDRISHNDVVARLRNDGEIASDVVAFRAVESDFEDFNNNEDQISYDLAGVFNHFDEIDLILDSRFCSTSVDVATIAQQIATFARRFCVAYDNVRRVIITGSSIPATIGDVIDVDSTEIVERRELAIAAKARELCELELIVGDYTTVSPFYSDTDLDPRMMQKVMTPRLIYPFDNAFFMRRGISLQSGGQEQYVGLTSDLCRQVFFRPKNSTGEDYFYDKSRRVGRNATNGTVVAIRRRPHYLHGTWPEALSFVAAAE